MTFPGIEGARLAVLKQTSQLNDRVLMRKTFVNFVRGFQTIESGMKKVTAEEIFSVYQERPSTSRLIIDGIMAELQGQVNALKDLWGTSGICSVAGNVTRDEIRADLLAATDQIREIAFGIVGDLPSVSDKAAIESQVRALIGTSGEGPLGQDEVEVLLLEIRRELDAVNNALKFSNPAPAPSSPADTVRATEQFFNERFAGIEEELRKILLKIQAAIDSGKLTEQQKAELVALYAEVLGPTENVFQIRFFSSFKFLTRLPVLGALLAKAGRAIEAASERVARLTERLIKAGVGKWQKFRQMVSKSKEIQDKVKEGETKGKMGKARSSRIKDRVIRLQKNFEPGVVAVSAKKVVLVLRTFRRTKFVQIMWKLFEVLFAFGFVVFIIPAAELFGAILAALGFEEAAARVARFLQTIRIGQPSRTSGNPPSDKDIDRRNEGVKSIEPWEEHKLPEK